MSEFYLRTESGETYVTVSQEETRGRDVRVALHELVVQLLHEEARMAVRNRQSASDAPDAIRRLDGNRQQIGITAKQAPK